MILTINLKKYPDLIKTIFTGEMKFLNELVDIILPLKNKKQLLEIIHNLFDEEYRKIFLKKDELNTEFENMYKNVNTLLTEKCSGIQTHYNTNIYKKGFSKLLKFDLNYQNFFSCHNNEIDIEEKSTYKLEIAQSLIRVIFNKEKQKYNNDKYYEYKLIKRIIDKDMEETIEKYGDQYKTLFRKEDICDDFLKYMFFVFGNKMIIESFINPLKKILNEIEPKDRNINKDEFNKLVTEFISKLKNTIPNVLKILLKLLYESVKSHFTIEDDNYGPLYTTLIFNFFISPRMQTIYSINASNNNFIRCLNRLLRNACFNFKFDEKDPLSEYNDIIEKNHLKIKNFIKENIIKINIEDNKVKSSLTDIFNENYLIFPNYLFDSDCNIIWETIDGGINDLIENEELKRGKDH